MKPYEYPELLEYVDAIRHSYWIHTEFNFTSDVQDFKVNVTDAERNALKNTMLAIAQIEVSVKTFWGDIYKRLPKPEIGSVGYTFAESEVRHHDAYSHLLEILGLNNDFNQIKSVPCIIDRVNYLERSIKTSSNDEEKEYAMAVEKMLAGRNVRLILEPGRSLVGNAGVLLTQVEYVKQGEEKNFVVVDAAMNDLMRPALYQAYHHIEKANETTQPEILADIVGPICETGDFLAQNRYIAAQAGDILIVHSAGAYGASMSSNYNTRPRAAEVLVDGDKVHEIRKRETLNDLMQLERECIEGMI